MAGRDKNRGKQIYKKIEYLENEKNFLDEIKEHFSKFLKGIIW